VAIGVAFAVASIVAVTVGVAVDAEQPAMAPATSKPERPNDPALEIAPRRKRIARGPHPIEVDIRFVSPLRRPNTIVSVGPFSSNLEIHLNDITRDRSDVREADPDCPQC
jgi:hypothetical protein